MKKVLLSAYACEPNRGSEPGVGWAWANSLNEHVSLTVVTRANNQKVIDEWYRKNGDEQAKPDFVYYDPPRWVMWLKKKRLFPVQFFYILWQLGVSWNYRADARQFDIIHHVTFNSMMMPGLWWFSRKPVILGPLGGTSCVRKDYRPLYGKKIWKEKIRECLIKSWVFLPWIRLSFNRASLILCANSETMVQVKRRYPKKAKLMLETGVSYMEPTQRVQVKKNGGGLRIIWIGTIEPWKALPLALHGVKEAIAKLSSCTQMHLEVVGQGSEMTQAEDLVRKLEIADCVTFHGSVAKHQVDDILKGADVLLFTSIKDTSGNVVLEAMSHAVPVICLNHQGVADITTDETAIRIEPGSIESTIEGIANALLTINDDPQRAQQLGEAGYRRVIEKYEWGARAKEMVEKYVSII